MEVEGTENALSDKKLCENGESNLNGVADDGLPDEMPVLNGKTVITEKKKCSEAKQESSDVCLTNGDHAQDDSMSEVKEQKNDIKDDKNNKEDGLLSTEIKMETEVSPNIKEYDGDDDVSKNGDQDGGDINCDQDLSNEDVKMECDVQDQTVSNKSVDKTEAAKDEDLKESNDDAETNSIDEIAKTKEETTDKVVTESDSKDKEDSGTMKKELPEVQNTMKTEEKNDSEKENVSNTAAVEVPPKNIPLTVINNDEGKDNDIEIIGESKLVRIDSPSMSKISPQNVVLLHPGYPPNFKASSPNLLSNNVFSPSTALPGSYMKGTSPFLSMPGTSTTAAPPKPKSSLDQIELIRWEIQNRLNTRPKYFKPNPTAELGSLAKFLFEIGSNLIKEAVYHELVKIQSKKNDENALSEKEKEDLEKLKEIEKDLFSTIGHLKLKMKKKCKVCHFQTESSSVLYHHKQFPHEDEKKLHCAHCQFVTKQTMNFKFHLESEHNVQPRLNDKKAFWECDLCPYENNQEQKLAAHKLRCIKQFRPLFNLHPSCLSGAEINLCLENIFYKPIIPKNLRLLQQKHAQQQAALAEARRQAAEAQALASQKNAAALAAAKQRQRQIAPAPATQQRFNTPNHNTRQVVSRAPPTPVMPPVQYNSKSVNRPVARQVVPNLQKDKPNRQSTNNSSAPPSAPKGFEVCEICGGYVKDRKALRIHFFYAHRIDLPFHLFDRHQPPLYCATCYVRFWTAQGLRKHIDVHVQEKKVPDTFMGEGVHGKCISCGQLVGNIVVHMRVVHNREIHHFINAHMCMFCGASFNSRANVERHVTEVHGVIDVATGAVKVKAKLKSTPQPPKQLPKVLPKQPPSSSRRSGNNKDSLVKGSVCVLCNLNFGRNVDLTRHCMRMHHTCMKCGMVVIDKASLLKHTCLTSPSGTRDCTMCSETGFHPAYYVKHLRDKHLKKFSITIGRVTAPVISKWIKRPYPADPAAECVEISDSDDEPVEISAPSPKPVKSLDKNDDTGAPSKKRARIGPASKIGRESVIDVDKEPLVKASKEPLAEEDEPVKADKEPKVETDKEQLVKADNEPKVETDKEQVDEAVKKPVAEADKEPVVEADKEPVVEGSKESDDEVDKEIGADKEAAVEADQDPVAEAEKEPVVETDKEVVDEVDDKCSSSFNGATKRRLSTDTSSEPEAKKQK